MAPGYNIIYKCTSRDCIENNLHFLRNLLLELAKIFVALQIAVKFLKKPAYRGASLGTMRSN